MFDDLDHLISTDPFAKETAKFTLKLKEGERREVCVLFADVMGFTSLSEHLDHEVVHTLLDKLMQLFTARIKHFGGFIDKYEGDLVMALFGAKVASEQDTERAIEAGLEMLAVLDQFNAALAKRLGRESNLGVRIGINTGEVTTGKVGEKREGDFTVYGDAVNLASRMESNAPLNRIMLPRATMQRVIQSFDFEPHGSIQVKGKSEPIDTWLVANAKGERLSRWQLRWTAFVGRETEMARLQERYEVIVSRITELDTSTDKPLVIGLKGEAGIGKSRLVDEFLRQEGSRDFCLKGSTSRLVQQSYGQFVTMIRRRLGISAIDSAVDSREKLQRGLEEMEQFLDNDQSCSRLRETEPMLGYLLGLQFEDVRLTLQPKELQPHLQTAIRYFIETCAAQANQTGLPLVVVLDDLQWTDAPSLATLEFLLFTLNLEEKRRSATSDRHSREGRNPLKQILFILTYRPEYSPSRAILTDSDYSEIDLSVLKAEDARGLIRSIIGDKAISDETIALVMERSAGNPFFLEEWAGYISDHPVIASQPQTGEAIPTKGALPVPATLQALILARMDRLAEDLKLLLQKAAVLGREFFVKVVEAMELKLAGKSGLDDDFSTLEEQQFIQSLPGRAISAYMFKHIMTQEVAYGTLLIANRKVLHRIAGEVIEELFANRLEEHWRDLAEHYEKGEVWDKAADYLLKAADLARWRYDNQTALVYYNRLLQLQVEHPETSSSQTEINGLLGKGAVLQLIGKWRAATEEYQRAVDLAYEIEDRPLAARALISRGALFFDKGKLDLALDGFQKSLAINEELTDKKGMSNAHGYMGGVFRIRGDYDRALEHYQKWLSIAEELDDKRGISRAVGLMGVVFSNRGDYDRAMECNKKRLSVAEELRDKLGISFTVCAMGNVLFAQNNYDDALECYQKSLSIAKELGDKQGISFAVGNTGNVFLSRGDCDSALECYQKSLSIAEELGDKHMISWAVGNMGNVYFEYGDYLRAEEKFERAVGIGRELNLKPLLAQILPTQARLALAQNQLPRASSLCNEALILAHELKNNDNILQAQILSHKIDFTAAEDDPTRTTAAEALNALLDQTTEEEHLANIHYELTAMHRALNHPDHTEHHRLEAIRLYESLYAKIPKFTFKKRLEELRLKVSEA